MGLWKALRSRGVPDVLLDLIVALHHCTGVPVQVRQDQNLSEGLLTTSGVRQGCILAPALFCVAIDWIPRHMEEKPVGSTSAVNTSATSCMPTTRPSSSTLYPMPFRAYTQLPGYRFGPWLRISWPKTKLQNLGAGHQPASVSVDGNAVDSVYSFVYLGSLLSSDGYCRPDILPTHRPSLISHVCSAQHWKDRYLSISTKIRIYYMQQKPGFFSPLTSKLLKPSLRDSCCRSAGNSSSETTRSQRLLACRRSRKSSATVVAPSSVTWRDYNKTSRRTRPSTATSTCLLVDHPTTSGNIARADPERDGSTKSGRTTESPRRTCGGERRVVVTEEQRYGLRWLCDNDELCFTLAQYHRMLVILSFIKSAGQ